MSEPSFSPSTSDEAVAAATGRRWAEWFALLDDAGARAMDHRQIVAHLAGQPGIGAWWQQTVAVNYEQARGLRDRRQAPDGYQVSASKTIGAAAERVFDAWHDDALRERWLPGESLTVRRATRPKSLRITWSDGHTHVEVNLTAKGEQKSQVAIGHTKLADAGEAARLKTFWGEALVRLKTLLEE